MGRGTRDRGQGTRKKGRVNGGGANIVQHRLWQKMSYANEIIGKDCHFGRPIVDLLIAITSASGFPFALELVFFIFEQDIKSGEATINPGNVLLQLYFIIILQSTVAIDVLFQHP